MAVSVESSSPKNLNKQQSKSFMSSSSPKISPSSDKRFWSTLRTRIDTILENRIPSDQSFSTQMNSGRSDRSKRMKEDSLLLLRGFDSVANSLSQLSNNLDNALQGARDLSRPPTLTDIYQSAMEKSKTKTEDSEENDGSKRGLKRKIDDADECSQEQQQVDDNPQKQNQQNPNYQGKLKKAKNIAISMATKAASIARELRSIRSDLCFMQDRCSLLEEENKRLREGFSEGIRPEEDDLVRLQLEALLVEKSRLANENANLTRENQCLHQLVEYHQLTSQDLSAATYEQMITGMCLDFDSPPPSIPEEERESDVDEPFNTPRNYLSGLSTSLDERYAEEQEQEQERAADA